MIDYNRIGISEKQKNILMVLDQITEQEETFATDIIKATGLSFATVSRAIATLKNADLVVTKGKEITDMGRHPEIVALNAEYGYLLHFHVGADFIRGYLADFCGNVLAQDEVGIDRNIIPEMFGKKLRECTNSMLKGCGMSYNKLLAASIAIPGLVDLQKHVVKRIPNFANFNNINLFKYVEKSMQLPVIINNEARLCAFGAFIHDFQDKPNLVYIDFTKYSGIGAGIIVDGKLVSGKNGFAGEMGDILVDIHNFEYEHNEDEGCLETMAGVGVLYEKIQALIERGHAAKLKDLMTSDGVDAIDLRLIEQSVLMHDLDVVDVFNDTMKKWTIAIINLFAILDPDLLILGGIINEENDVVLTYIRHNISKILFHDIDIVLGETNEYQMYGGMYMLKVHVLNNMLVGKIFA